MSKNAPTVAPTNAPTAAPTKSEMWKKHWRNYNDPRPVPYKGKIAWAVTKPKELWKKTDRDKKLSSGTSDPKMAERVKWEIAAKIYQWFDNKLQELKPQIEKSNKEQFIALAQKQWVKHKHPADKFLSNFPLNDPEMDDVIRLFNSMDIEVTDDMLDLLDDEARWWVTNHPLQAPITEQEKIELDKFGSKDLKSKTETLKKLSEMLGKAVDTDDKDLIDITTAAINNELTRPEFRQAYQDITSKDRELADKVKAKSGKFSSTISAVGKRYIKERKWNKQSTKSGATTAIKRFVNFIGDKTDISDVNEKHAHSFAKWMEDELGSANKSIKSSTSYVKGMFAWAIRQQAYKITKLPWDKLDGITEYGVASQSYKPFTVEQLHELFSLTKLDGKGRMNSREHLLLAILITTGCRMDEAALLTWNNIIKHERGFHYIDLTEAIVKNEGSKRRLPIPEVLWNIMPQHGHQLTVDGNINSPGGSLFNYAIYNYGKDYRAES